MNSPLTDLTCRGLPKQARRSATKIVCLRQFDSPVPAIRQFQRPGSTLFSLQIKLDEKDPDCLMQCRITRFTRSPCTG